MIIRTNIKFSETDHPKKGERVGLIERTNRIDNVVAIARRQIRNLEKRANGLEKRISDMEKIIEGLKNKQEE